MIDPKSIKPEKYKREDAILALFMNGGTVRSAAISCGVSTKTAHRVMLKHADKIPKRKKMELVPRKEKPALKSRPRSFRMPGDIDAAICKEARTRSVKYQDLVFEVLGQRYGLNRG